MATATRGWRIRVAGVLLAPLAALGAPAPGRISLHPVWKPGTEQRYLVTADYRQSAGDQQDHAPPRHVAQSATLLLTVSEADDAGGATLRLTFESLHTELASPGNESGEVFDWKSGPEQGRPQALPADDGKPSPLAQLSGALAGCTLTVVVNPDGSVAAVTGLGSLATALGQQGGDTASLQGLGFFSPPRLESNLAMLWRIDPEGRPREPGAAWRTSERLSMRAGYDADMAMQWTLTGVDGSTAAIAGAVNITPAPTKREADPASPRLEIKDQSGTVSAEWDTAAGLLIGRVDDRTITWTAAVDLGPGAATPTVAAESKATSRVEIRLVR